MIKNEERLAVLFDFIIRKIVETQYQLLDI